MLAGTHVVKLVWQKQLDGITSLLLGSFFEYDNVLILGTNSGNLRVWKEERVGK